MGKITLTDILQIVYGSTEESGQLSGPPPSPDNTALLLIDIQGLVTPEYMAKAAVKAGLPDAPVNAALADYGQRFYSALDVCSRVLQAAREHGVPPIHVKIEALSGDGRDASPLYRMVGWSYPRDAEATRFLSEVDPEPDEIALTKTVGGAFTGTILDRVLRHMGIWHLYICGFVTDECVETTLRDALDHGYMAAVIQDATTAYTEEAHSHMVAKFGGFGMAPTSDEVLGLFGQFPQRQNRSAVPHQSGVFDHSNPVKG